MTVKVMKNGKIVGSSKNLEIVTRYARTHSPVKNMYMEHNGYTLLVIYKDGATIRTDFASGKVLRQYLMRRGYA